MIKIGISACFFHADPVRPIFKGKTLLYIEQSLAHWVQDSGALAFMVPSMSSSTSLQWGDWVCELDGLILHGGSDVSPTHYGEKPLKPEWCGDYVRDLYEIQLYQAFLKQKKPVLGICRGAQLLNVACGGSLYQDITTQVPGALVHRNWDIYDQNFHSIQIEPNSILKKIYSNPTSLKVNSIHHQGIKDLGKNLVAEAYSPDGIIEAIRLKSETFVCAVQWHPEFHDPKDHSLLPKAPLMSEFLHQVQKRKETGSC